MDPVTAMAISGGISALSNFGGGFMSAGGAAAQNAAAQQRNQNEMAMFNRQNDLNQWYFQKQFENEVWLSGSAYQRAMADMRAAGLNPILAYQQGGAGGHAGSGQSAGGSLSDPMPANPGSEMGRGISRAVQSGLDAATTYQNLGNLAANEKLTMEQAQKTEVDRRKSEAEILNTMANTNLTTGQEKLLKDTQGRIIADTAAAYAAAGASASSAKSYEASARRTNIAADKEATHGYGTPADLADQAEKASRRIMEQLRGAQAVPHQMTRPFTGLRNQ